MGRGSKETNEEESATEDENTEMPESQKFDEGPDGIELRKVRVDRDIVNSPIVVIGDTKPYFKTTHLKNSLLLFNGVLGVLGLALMIIGIWARVDPNFLMYETSLEFKSFYAVCFMCIVAGVILVIVSCCGCFGVLIEHKPLLWTYFVIFIIIFLIELAAVILVFSAPYSKTIQSGFDKQIKKQLTKSNEDDSSRYFMDLMQQRLRCCGSTNQDDYVSKLPNSCKNPDTAIVFSNGCVTEVVKYLRNKAAIFGGITIPILLIQLLAKFLCFCLIQNLRQESAYSMRA